MPRSIRFIVPILSLLLLSACGSDMVGPNAIATGRWSGTMQSTDVAGTTLVLQIVESGGTVTGTANIGGTNVPVQLTVTGTYAAPSLSVIMTQGGLHPPANLTGQISGNTMSAVVNGSGFINDPVTLTRQ